LARLLGSGNVAFVTYVRQLDRLQEVCDIGPEPTVSLGLEKHYGKYIGNDATSSYIGLEEQKPKPFGREWRRNGGK
jgi:hypothetical protein